LADFYFDHNVAFEIATALRVRGHGVVTARDMQLERAYDPEHLFVAAARRWVLVTHNKNDFILLHRAWRYWSGAWGTERQHGGVLIIPEKWRGDIAAAHIELFALDRPLTDELHIGHVHGDWRQVL
jgi:hypothetical protein